MSKQDNTITLTAERLHAARAQIQQLYLRYKLPWIVGLSQGKDSTASAQLIWEAIAALLVEQRTHPIHIVMGDTRMEAYPIAQRIHLTARLMNEAAQRQEMPITVHIAQPAVTEHIWVRIIGYGYAAPTVKFRWCVERTKINPIARVIKSVCGEHGRAIQVLGSRVSESANRAGTIKRYEIPGHPFGQGTVRGIYTYLPIRDWSTADVWLYLSQNASPWGGLRYNLDLRALYKASDAQGECPLVMDKSSPACGSGRFGCYMCTVATQNASLYALVDDPAYEWMFPLVEVYEFLRLTTDPANKPLYRDPKRMPNGSIKMLTRDPNTPTPGKYKFSVRLLLLEMVLKAQTEMRREGPDQQLTLLTEDELRAIRHLLREHPDHPSDGSDPVRAIVERTTGQDLGEHSPDDARLLELPVRENDTGTEAAEQLTFDLFAGGK